MAPPSTFASHASQLAPKPCRLEKPEHAHPGGACGARKPRSLIKGWGREGVLERGGLDARSCAAQANCLCHPTVGSGGGDGGIGGGGGDGGGYGPQRGHTHDRHGAPYRPY